MGPRKQFVCAKKGNLFSTPTVARENLDQLYPIISCILTTPLYVQSCTEGTATLWLILSRYKLLVMYRAGANPRPIADPPAGGPEPPPTNTQESITGFSVKDFQPRVSIEAAQIIGKRTRNSEVYTPTEGTGRITTREV
jgi:hypothetical protein